MALSKQLLDKIACPGCGGGLEVVNEGEGLACAACRLLFEVEDGIPCFILEEAKPWPAASA